MSYLIILDVDETLIHSEFKKENPFDGITEDYFEITVDGDKAFVALRPHLKEFFDYLKSRRCHVMIYSAGAKNYVEAIAKYLSNKFDVNFFRILSRSDCEFDKDSVNKYKADFDSKKTILVDDRIDVGRMYKYTHHLAIYPFYTTTRRFLEQDTYLLVTINKINAILTSSN